MDGGRVNGLRHGNILVGWVVEAAVIIVVEAAVFVAVASEAEAVVPPAVSMLLVTKVAAAHPAAAMVGREGAAADVHPSQPAATDMRSSKCAADMSAS
jgi:hypothetical protein